MSIAPLYLGIDLGTSGVRAIAIDAHESVVAQAAVPLPSPEVAGHHIEQDPRRWWRAVENCLEYIARDIEPRAVTAIAVDGTSATLLLSDADGTPTGPALMYHDSRALAQAQHISKVAPTATAAQGPGCTLAKLLWLHEHGALRSTTRLWHQADWIAAQLRGDQHTITDLNNAMKLGYDAVQGCWPDWLRQLLESAGIAATLLPEVVQPGTITGNIDAALAQRLGFAADTRIVAGTTDSTAALLATGARAHGEAVTALGSTLVVKVIATQPVFAAEYGIYSQPLLLDGHLHWLVGGASNCGGAVLRQFFSDAQLAEMTPRLRPAQATGLDYYPLPAVGERFPVSDPRLAPRLMPRPADDVEFFQGILEALAGVEARGYRLLHTLGAPYPQTVYTTGGGAGNPAWTQIRQQQLQTAMRTARHTQAAYGCACLARQAMTPGA